MESLQKKEVGNKVYRVFKNRFSAYILQEKPKNLKGNWKIINGFGSKKTAISTLESISGDMPRNKRTKISFKEVGLLRKSRLLQEFIKLRSRGLNVCIM